MTKPPYVKSWQLRTDPHLDYVQGWVYYKDGRVVQDQNRMTSVNNITVSHYHTSESTKPWPDGYPPRWAPQHRNHWKWTADFASGQVIWTPGVQQPDVSHTLHMNSGGWGRVFGRLEDSFWSIADRDKPSRDTLDNKIRLKLVDPWNAATMMAEMSTTVEGIAKRLGTLAQAALALKRGRLDLALRILGYPRKKQLSSARRRSLRREIVDPRYREFASNWLELQYGWLPLLSDIHGMIDFSKNRPPRTFIRASSTSEISRSRSSVTSSKMTGARSRNTDTVQGRCRRAWIAEVRTSDEYLRHLNSVGLLNPVSVVWELVPFSFVVDWFLPIGDFLQSATATIGVQVVRTLYTERLDYQTYTASSLVPASSAYNASGYGGFGQRYHVYSRSSPPFPSAKMPSFKNPLSVYHAANALALLTQSLKR